ncbi:baseplate J/gp47 family protein [Methylobacterium sp. P1-11]|uniref:baseplate J/gp47 family protein n=1 Tax=Methylobacterium sp. P1-11 TaxID=2024616 RepID=UPI001A8CC434|nr:baseplate J/gp47 family protein [Methylobacterium sp. P1-11]
MNLDPATQDGQFLALLAYAIHDANGETLAAYNSFSPSTAQGTGLDRNVKLNGIRRKRATYSTAPFLIVGQAGIEIDGGIVTDAAGNQWALPSVVVIPDIGQITVTATCQTIGAITLSAGAVDTANGKGSIATITRGWQTATNTAAASVGLAVETDSALRQRQAISTALPSQRLIDGLTGALAAIAGVNRLKVHENPTNARDVNGIPGHMIAAVVDGGDPAAIASVIELKKGPGVSTFGTTVQTVQPIDNSTIPQDVAFFYLTQVPITYQVTVRNLGGYTASAEGIWKAALADFVNGLAIGEDVEWDQAFAAAKNFDGLGSKTFKIISFKQARDGGTPTEADVPIAFYEAGMCSAANIAVTVQA